MWLGKWPSWWWDETKDITLENQETPNVEDLSELSDEVLKKNNWFYKLKEDINEKPESLNRLFDLFEKFVDYSLDWSFNTLEKDRIKLVLVWELWNQLDEEGGINIFALIKENFWDLNDILKKIILRDGNMKKENWELTINDKPSTEKKGRLESELKTSLDDIKGSFSKLWLWVFLEEINKKITFLNKEKKSEENKSFDSVWSVFNILNPDTNKSESEVIDNIKNKTNLIVDKLKPGLKTADKFKGLFDKIPDSFKDKIKEFFKSISKDFPIIWILLSVIFWIDFLDEEWDKESKSLKNLAIFSEDDKFPFKERIKKWEIETIKSDKLEKFYKFLKVKGIDYSKENFWNDILTSESKDKKLKEVYLLLKWEDWNILTWDYKIEDLLNLLNSLEEKEKTQERTDREEKNKQAQAAIDIEQRKLEELRKQKELLTITQTSPNQESTEEIIGADNQWIIETSTIPNDPIELPVSPEVAELQKAIDLQESAIQKIEETKIKSFWEYLKEWKIMVWNVLEEISINSDNHILNIWNINYKISIVANMKWFSFGWDRLDEISFSEWVIIVKAGDEESKYAAADSEFILKQLLTNWHYNEKITWKPANFIIEKVS